METAPRTRIQPEVCHLNEGHAAFAVLERARNFMEEQAAFRRRAGRHASGEPLHTHTAVAAVLIVSLRPHRQYLGGYAEHKLGIRLHDLLALAARIRTTRWRLSTWPIWHRAAGR